MNINSNICSICKEKIILPNRLITDSCGHIKCRNCLISKSEEFNCRQCISISLQEEPLKNLRSNQREDLSDCEFSINEKNGNKIQIIENILIKSKNIVNKKISSKFVSSVEASADIDKIYQKNPEIEIADFAAIERIESSINRKRKSIKIKECNHIVQELDYFKCKICNKKFHSRNQKYYHLYCDKKNFPYKCNICNKGFATSYHLKYHEETHKSNVKLECNICNQSFSNKITLRNHKLKIHQNNRKTYNCNICNQSYKEKTYYLDHLNKHSNLFPYSCKKCEKTFSSKANLLKHKHYENEDKKYRCNNCSKAFYRKSSLNNHFKLKHSLSVIEKNYDQQCCECFKIFHDKKSFARHQNVHNAKTYYQCALCYLTSVRKDNLTRHLKNMHPNENISQSINTIKKACTLFGDKPSISLPKVITEEITEEIKVTSSVIRSIGNVKPLKVENYGINKLNNEEFSSKRDNNDKQDNHEKLVNKKFKKKYDPTEIYRKILFGGNDDSNEPAELYEPIKLGNKDVMNNEYSEAIAIDTANETTPLSKFSEKHWRKNFTYNYTNNNF